MFAECEFYLNAHGGALTHTPTKHSQAQFFTQTHAELLCALFWSPCRRGSTPAGESVHNSQHTERVQRERYLEVRLSLSRERAKCKGGTTFTHTHTD